MKSEQEIEKAARRMFWLCEAIGRSEKDTGCVTRHAVMGAWSALKWVIGEEGSEPFEELVTILKVASDKKQEMN